MRTKEEINFAIFGTETDPRSESDIRTLDSYIDRISGLDPRQGKIARKVLLDNPNNMEEALKDIRKAKESAKDDDKNSWRNSHDDIETSVYKHLQRGIDKWNETTPDFKDDNKKRLAENFRSLLRSRTFSSVREDKMNAWNAIDDLMGKSDNSPTRMSNIASLGDRILSDGFLTTIKNRIDDTRARRDTARAESMTRANDARKALLDARKTREEQSAWNTWKTKRDDRKEKKYQKEKERLKDEHDRLTWDEAYRKTKQETDLEKLKQDWLREKEKGELANATTKLGNERAKEQWKQQKEFLEQYRKSQKDYMDNQLNRDKWQATIDQQLRKEAADKLVQDRTWANEDATKKAEKKREAAIQQYIKDFNNSHILERAIRTSKGVTIVPLAGSKQNARTIQFSRPRFRFKNFDSGAEAITNQSEGLKASDFGGSETPSDVADKAKNLAQGKANQAQSVAQPPQAQTTTGASPNMPNVTMTNMPFQMPQQQPTEEVPQPKQSLADKLMGGLQKIKSKTGIMNNVLGAVDSLKQKAAGVAESMGAASALRNLNGVAKIATKFGEMNKDTTIGGAAQGTRQAFGM